MRKLVLLCMLLLACLTTACSPPPAENAVLRLTSVENVLYHQFEYEEHEDGYYGYEGYAGAIHSTDGGRTWESEASPPEAVQQYFANPHTLPISKCLSERSALCYRVTEQGEVEKSTDRGTSWTLAWAPSATRHSFIQRFYRLLKKSGCEARPPNAFPHDLAITDHGAGRYFVTVAMGNEGVVILDENGHASRHAVYCAAPTPYQFTEIRASVEATLWESFFLALAILIANPFYSRTLTDENTRKVLAALFGKLLLYGAVFLALVGVFLSHGHPIGLFLPVLLPIALPIFFFYFYLPTLAGSLPLEHIVLLFLLLVAAWMVRKSLKPSVVLNPLVDLPLMLAAFTPFPLWALGILSSYYLAWALCLLVAGAILWLSNRGGFGTILWEKSLLPPVSSYSREQAEWHR